MVSAPRVVGQVAIRRVVKAVRGIEARLSPVLLQMIRDNPDYTSDLILNRPEVVTFLNSALQEAKANVLSELRATYIASGLLGSQVSQREFTQAGLEPPVFSWNENTPYFTSILHDINVMFEQTREDIRTSIAKAYDAVEPDQFGLPVERVRAIDSRIAVNQAVRRLAARASASASVVSTRGRSEAKLESYLAFQAQNPGLTLKKKWRTTSVTPCPACTALDGTVIELHKEFDHHATTTLSFTLPRVYYDLLVPPRHPNCRCEIILIAEEIIEQEIEQELKEPLPSVDYVYTTADDVRAMPSKKYRTLVSFLKKVITKVKKFVRRLR